MFVFSYLVDEGKDLFPWYGFADVDSVSWNHVVLGEKILICPSSRFCDCIMQSIQKSTEEGQKLFSCELLGGEKFSIIAFHDSIFLKIFEGFLELWIVDLHISVWYIVRLLDW